MEPAVSLHLAEPDFPSDDQDGALAGRDYGPITPLLNDDTISEVMVNGPNQVYIERKGQLTPVDVKFESDAELIRVIREIASCGGRRGPPVAGDTVPVDWPSTRSACAPTGASSERAATARPSTCWRG